MLKDCREVWYDKENKVSVTLVDVTSAAQALARGHLAGPTSAYFLAKGLAAAALLGAEMEDKEETLIVQMKCTGPLGGYTVECTAQGTLRGYTDKKVLDAFDGLGAPDEKLAVGDSQVQVTRSVPGRILSQGLSNSLDGYLAGSLQRKACLYLEAAVSDEVEILEARGVLVEALPDSKWSVAEGTAALEPPRTRGGVRGTVAARLTGASRSILERIGLERAELKGTTPLSFACRCSPERAVTMLQALSPEERATLPPTLDVTCHMCGKIFTVKTGTQA